MQPDEPAFPDTQDTLGLLASPALPAGARARHLHAIRLRAAELGPAPAPAGHREARRLSPSPDAPLEKGLSGLRWRGRRAAAVAGVWLGSLSLGTGVAAAAAMDDLPGDALYGLKRAVETVQLRLPGDVQDDVRRRLELAARRLAEAEALRAQDAESGLLVGVLGDAESLIDQAGKLAAGDQALTAVVAESASHAQSRLTELLNGGLPDQAAERAREAIEAATERAGSREDGERGRGNGDGERDRSGQGPGGQPPGRDDDDDDDRGRGRGRGGEDDDTSAPGTSAGEDPPPSEADDAGDDDGAEDDDEDSSPSGRGRSSDEPDDDPGDGEEDEGDDSGSGSGQGQNGSGQSNSGQGNSGNGGGNSGQGNSGKGQD